MEKKTNVLKTGFSSFLWVVIAVVLCTAPSVLADIDITQDVQGDLTVVSGTTVNLYANVLGPIGITVEPGSQLNIYSGNVTGFFGINVLTGSIDAVITVYGTDFADLLGPISTDQWDPTGTGGNILTVTYTDGNGNPNGDPVDLLFFSDKPINLVNTAAVSDPAQMIQDLIDTVTGMNLQQGIDNSLDAKLDAALGALDDVNANNNAAAINTLQAFINAVEAQRDSKITSAQADILIAAAQAIIDLLST